MAQIDWHFPRPVLAKIYLDRLFSSGINRIAFFGRRRIGKTEFMLRDMIPAAEKMGAVAIYCSMWENMDKPYLALLNTLRSLAKPEKDTKLKIKLKGTLTEQVEGGIEIERASKPIAAATEELQEITRLFQALLKANLKKRKKCLIVLDEIQHLATSARFATFAATLRTMLDMAGDQVKVVFTGSSYADLHKLFKDTKAPFFDFADIVTFEPMSHDFVQHLEHIYRQITHLTLPPNELDSVFEQSGRNAHITRALVQRLVLGLSRDVLAEWEKYKDELMGPDGWCERQWERMVQSDRIVYRLIMDGKEPFCEQSLARYRKAGFSAGTAQQAINRLMNRGLIIKISHGNYATDVPILDLWVKRFRRPKLRDGTRPR